MFVPLTEPLFVAHQLVVQSEDRLRPAGVAAWSSGYQRILNRC